MDRTSTAEAARYLGVTPRTLYRLIDERCVSAYRDGRVISLDRAEVERYDGGFDDFGDGTDDREPRTPRDPRDPRDTGALALEVPD